LLLVSIQYIAKTMGRKMRNSTELNNTSANMRC
jgi:hypothetical protein